MSKLGELQTAEDDARIEVEKAEKEAQRIRISISELLEEQSREKDNQLKATLKMEKEKIERRTAELAESLTSQTEKELKELSQKSDILEKAATEQLKEIILTSGNESR